MSSELGAFFSRACIPVIVVDANGRLVTANDAALLQYGFSLDELVQMRIHDLLAQARPELERDLQRAFRGDREPLDRRLHRRKDGSLVWVVPRAGPVSIEGETFIVSALEDVTAIVDAEHETRRAHDRTEVVWDAAATHFGRSFALLDDSGRIVKSSDTLSSRLGCSEADLMGKKCSEVFVSSCLVARCPHEVAIREGRRVVSEFVAPGGQPVRLEVWPAPPNHAGIATIHVAHDLSEEHALRTRLATTERLATLGRTFAGVAHEVNNPAAFVTLALPMVRERMTQGRLPEAMTLLDEAAAAVRQINEVMRDLGGVARDRARALVDLTGVVSGALRIASIEAEARARIVRTFEEGVVAAIRGPRIAQVVINLVLNAAQAIPEGEPGRNWIEICVRSAHGRAIVEVSDTGPGISQEIGERLFQPFFTTRSVTGGTGLGLWLSRAIVEEEGGTLSWCNRPAGGATFTVELPMLRAAPKRVASAG